MEKVVRGSTARCKSTGVKFAKGGVRGVVQVGATKQYHALAAMKRMLAPVYALPEVVGCQEARIESTQGIEQLGREDHAVVLGALHAA